MRQRRARIEVSPTFLGKGPETHYVESWSNDDWRQRVEKAREKMAGSCLEEIEQANRPTKLRPNQSQSRTKQNQKLTKQGWPPQLLRRGIPTL